MNVIKKSLEIIKEKSWNYFFKKLWVKFSILILHRRAIIVFNQRKIISRLKNFNSNDPEKILNFSFNFYSEFIKPIQIKEEFLELLKIFQKQNPKYILEIGTANGGSLFCFCKLAREDATIISIDLPGGKFGGGYPEWKIPIYQAFAKENQKLYLLRKDSHREETLEEVKRILNGNQLDFLFIDGDHSYEGVKKDFEMYSPLVKKEGIIAFHDIVRHPLETGCEVEKLWKEIKNGFNFKELIKDINQNWAGIGVIFKL
jgi:predicted O-methyltransferase YrrM